MILPGNEPIHYQIEEVFDPVSGLFVQESHGHTLDTRDAVRVRNAVNTSTRLMIAAQLDRLDAFPVDAVLSGLRRVQHLADDDLRGCLRWYAEDRFPHDANAAFFIGLDLIVLARRYADRLSPTARDTLDAILRDLAGWFDRHTRDAQGAAYPNKFLGDLVCAWLLRELQGRAAEPGATSLANVMRTASAYWRDTHWGWGEHLSDPYAAILLDELSALLLLAKELPADLRAAYETLFHDLLRVDDAYAGGPRVPTIRNYLFGAPAPHTSYRDTVRPWQSAADACHNREQIPHMFKTPYGRLFGELGWHHLAGPREPTRPRVSVPCLGGASAEAWFGADARLGVMTRYPIMPGSDQPTWGLSWQSMPAAFATAGSWNFLRWRTLEAGVQRSHPARDKHAALRRNALTDALLPPVVGQTHARLDGARAVILRHMPAVPRAWEMLADEIVLTGDSVLTVAPGEGGFTRLQVCSGDALFTLYVHAFGARPETARAETPVDRAWSLRYDAAALTPLHSVTTLWCIAAGDAPAPALVARMVRPDRIRQSNEHPCRLAWGELSYDLDPLADTPVLLAS